MKLFKKLLTILTIVLIAIMAFAPAKSFAEGEVELTVTGPDEINITGKTIEVYKLFDITEDGEYTWDEESAAYDFFNTKYGYTTVLEATEYVRTLSGTELTEFAEDYYDYCDENNVTPDGSQEAADNQATFTLTKGYYLVYDVAVSEVEDEEGNVTTVGKSVAILRNLTENTTTELKIETVEKPNKEADKTSANVGDTVNFTVKSEVPNTTGYTTYTYVVKDTLSEGLTLDTDSIKVQILKYDENGELIEEVDDEGNPVYYTAYTTTGTDANHLVLSFTSEDFLKLTAGSKIVITYSATINEKAAKAVENTNKVEIEYSNDPTDSTSTTTTPPDIVKVYTYGLDITKTNIDNEALNGAKFVLILSETAEETVYATFDENGVYTGKTTVYEEATVLVSNGTTTKTTEDGEEVEVELGKISISGLAAGTYILKEIEAPEGYDAPSVGFKFTIADATTETGYATFTYKPLNTAVKGYVTADQLTSSTTHFTVNILNAHEGELPTTGGIGTTIFTVVGIVVMLAAVVALVARNRKND